jgi:hypothetical protein
VQDHKHNLPPEPRREDFPDEESYLEVARDRVDPGSQWRALSRCATASEGGAS